VTATYTGQITDLIPGTDFAIGDTITDQVTFDTAKLVDVTATANAALISIGGVPLGSVKSASLSDDPNASMSISINGVTFSKFDAVDYGTPFAGGPIDLGVGNLPAVFYIDGSFAGIASIFSNSVAVLNTDPIAAAEGFLVGFDFIIADQTGAAAGVYDVADAVFSPAHVPEPTSWALLAVGIAGVVGVMRIRKK
jgi:hypothetical protein